jgi:hypothetical protein
MVDSCFVAVAWVSALQQWVVVVAHGHRRGVAL